MRSATDATSRRPLVRTQVPHATRTSLARQQNQNHRPTRAHRVLLPPQSQRIHVPPTNRKPPHSPVHTRRCCTVARHQHPTINMHAYTPPYKVHGSHPQHPKPEKRKTKPKHPPRTHGRSLLPSENTHQTRQTIMGRNPNQNHQTRHIHDSKRPTPNHEHGHDNRAETRSNHAWPPQKGPNSKPYRVTQSPRWRRYGHVHQWSTTRYH